MKMLNKLQEECVVVFILAALLCSCKQEPSYVIYGIVENPEYEGQKVYLLGESQDAYDIQKDSTMVVGGKYVFEGSVAKPQPGMVTIFGAEVERNVLQIGFCLENAEITIHTDEDGWSVVSGTEYNDAYQHFQEARRGPRERLGEIMAVMRQKSADNSLTQEEKEKLEAEWEVCRQEEQDICFYFIKDNINNPAFWGDARVCASRCSLEKQRELLAQANATTLGSADIKDVVNRIAALEKTAVGQHFIDLHMFDQEGNEISLSDYAGKGKYVLIDFWASWCVPCREEMPNVKAVYEKYKDKGFEVVGISCDNNHDAWVKAIHDLELPWKQMSDLKWEANAIYGINGIPYTVLLDPDGIIVARDLRGEQLGEKLTEVFNK